MYNDSDASLWEMEEVHASLPCPLSTLPILASRFFPYNIYVFLALWLIWLMCLLWLIVLCDYVLLDS